MPSAKRNSSPSLAAQIAAWRDGSNGFFQFLEDVQPRVRSHTGGFIPYELSGEPKREVERALDSPDVSIAVWCWPRRHGKTLVSAMTIIWRFLTRPNENIAVVANSEKQVLSTAMRTIRQAFEQTPFLKQLVAAGSITVLQDRIEFPATGSIIQAYSANPAALFGKALSCAQISELHAAPNGEAVFTALSGSLLDTAGSLLLIDSTVGPKSSKLFELYQAATREMNPDASIAFSHIEYADLDDACRNAPPWINAIMLRSLAGQMLPQDFNLYHLGRWSDASSALFPADILAACIEEYPLDLKALTNGSAYIVGGGLDRAFGGSKHGDATVTACVAKIVLDDEEHIYVLDADAVFLGRLGGIKSRFDGYHKDYDMSRLTLESFGAQDVADWARTRPYGGDVEVVHPSRGNKYAAFMTLYQAASEQRLHVHQKFKDLLAEMKVFEVLSDGKATDGKATDGQAAIPKFTHPRGAHDDFVHAVAWAVYGLRTVSLNPYEVEGINCNGRGADVAMCVLNGGGVTPLCATSCRSMREVHRLYEAYRSRKSLSPLNFETFVMEKVKNVGAHTMPR